MGHSTGKILERYTHLVDADLDEFITRDAENLPKNLPRRGSAGRVRGDFWK